MANHIHVPENTIGKDYIIGDLHGCLDAFNAALRVVNFNPEKDRIFSVGDLVDRGKHNEECAQLLSEPWFFAVRGNHEQMAIDYVDGIGDRTMYQYNGGAWFLDLPSSMKKYYAEEFRKMPIVMTVGGKYGIVHADVPMDDWNDFIEAILPTSTKDFSSIIHCAIWSRDKIHSGDSTVIKGIDVVFCGHTPVKAPVELGNVRYIDTGCVFEKSLTIATLDGTLTYKVPFLRVNE